MSAIKILCVWGTRPETIKMASVLSSLKRRAKCKVQVCVTSQHTTMLRQALKTFNIAPDYDMGIMRRHQTLEHITTAVIEGMSRILRKDRTDLVLIQGDTTTAFAACLATFYQKIPVGHVEAGLRTHNVLHPFPEELNRVAIDRMAALHFAPTQEAKQNLLKEQTSSQSIFVTGNTVVDPLKWYLAETPEPTSRKLTEIFKQGPVILVTAHRRENLGKPLIAICQSLLHIARRHPLRILFVVHPNPRVKDAVHELARHQQIHLITPLSYPDFLYALKHCLFVLTDSGGVQEEAPYFRKPVIILRDITERPEAIRFGEARVSGVETQKIIRLTERLLEPTAVSRIPPAYNLFGDGMAGERIAKAILYYFNGGPRPHDWHWRGH